MKIIKIKQIESLSVHQELGFELCVLKSREVQEARDKMYGVFRDFILSLKLK
jgi:hypothetical protein